jgi:hypothetical protein
MSITLTDIVATKRFTACGNDEFWYEDTSMPGTMVELTAASGEIDTSDMLSMFEAYQKCFIVNGTKLKVADFVNTKLACTALTTAHAHGDILTQATSGAKMVVDFINGSKTLVYGYVTSGTFDASHQVTGSGSGTAFTPSAVTAKPHWYDWEVYPGISGHLPNKSYLGCRYRGRAVLSGNPEYPQQWYMSRQANPWDWEWATIASSDAQRPMQGGLGEAGQAGDIIRALIPCGDDYLIFGCAGTMSVMTGDPAAGGSINIVDGTTGIFGATSWCFVAKDKVAFWGFNGLYIGDVVNGFKCVSEIQLPNLVEDEAANPETYRITMGFDVKRQGILICITELADGTNSNYFYSLLTKAFFPEEYPEECGVYSMVSYQANDPAYAGLLVGCTDGYIRKFDDTVKNDDIGPSDEAIDSYVSFGPIQLSKETDDASLANFGIITGGGQTGGHTDSNNISYKVFAANTAEEVMEKLDADTAPNLAGTTNNASKRIFNDPRQVRGVYAAIKLGNNTVNQTWSFEKLVIGE